MLRFQTRLIVQWRRGGYFYQLYRAGRPQSTLQKFVLARSSAPETLSASPDENRLLVQNNAEIIVTIGHSPAKEKELKMKKADSITAFARFPNYESHLDLRLHPLLHAPPSSPSNLF